MTDDDYNNLIFSVYKFIEQRKKIGNDDDDIEQSIKA